MKERMDFVGGLIEEIRPDVLCLQEVTRESLAYLSNCTAMLNYKVIPATFQQMENCMCPYFVVLMYNANTAAIKNDRYRRFANSIMGRGLLSCSVQLKHANSKSTTTWTSCGTVHLESYANKQSFSKARLEQMSLATSWLTKYHEKERSDGGGIVLLGDTNWKDPWKEYSNDGLCLHACHGGGSSSSGSGSGSGWRDAWIDSHNIKEEPGFTLDGKTNGMLVYHYRNRLDRCLYKSSPASISSSITVSSSRLIGK
jgi:endonuclease/exonuclease/phosphatase family metal-dependent hydrolase